jgi:hypothetical protein
MARLGDLHLIRFFSFYLTVIFLVSTYLRLRQYLVTLNLVRAFPERWPRLFGLVRQHKQIFLTWQTVLPSILSLALLTAHTVAAHFIWPQADFTLARLLELWPAVPVVALTGAAMIAFDVYGTLRVGQIDQAEMEKYFGQAEYWLRSKAAHFVRVVTFGFVNPRKMVAEEVQKALINASNLVNSTLWWTVIQTCLRLAFGLSLWTAFVLQDRLRSWAGPG